MPNYFCEICQKESSQKKHHQSHIETEIHQTKKEVVKLKMESISAEERIEKYSTDNLETILDKLENSKKVKKIIKKVNDFIPKKINGNITWENTLDVNDYENLKHKLNNVVKSAHQILYNNGSIVGSKAVTDIQKLLSLKLLEREFNNPLSVAGKSLRMVKSKTNSVGGVIEKYIKCCKNLSLLKDIDNPLNFWSGMVSRVLMETYPYVFGEEDKKFNVTSENGFQDLVSCICSLDITDEFLDSFATTCGDVHEAFLAYGGGKASKELGQFFTPRKLIHLIFKGTILEEYINKMDEPSIYDPCMGTGGFLTRTFKHCEILSENVYGCETEQDTIKFAFTSCLMTMGDTKSNLIRCNSLSQNKLVFEKKMSSIVTNPPFGTKKGGDKLEI